MTRRPGFGRRAGRTVATALLTFAPLTLVECDRGGNVGNLQQARGSLNAVPTLDLGRVPVGDRASQILAFSAVEQDVLVEALYIDGGSDFSAASTTLGDGGSFPGTLAVNQVGQTVVTVNPTAAGARAAVLTLAYPTSNPGSPTTRVQLSATGVALSDIGLQVTPPALDFGSVSLGSFGELPITVHNTNTFPITVRLDLADAGPFFSASSGFRLESNQQVDVPITFLPVAVGAATSQLQAAPCAQCPPQPVPLSGTGVTANVKFSPDTVDFGFALDGTVTAPSHITVHVNGNVPVRLTDIPRVPNDRNTIFQITNVVPSIGATGLQIDPNDGGPSVLSFDLSYTPSLNPNGDRTTIALPYAIASNPNPLQATLPAVGNLLAGGCRLAISPRTGIDFGTVLPAVPPPQVSRVIRVLNVGGGTCQLQGAQILDGGDPDFAVGAPDGDGGNRPPTVTASIAPHSELPGGIPVTFTAPADANRYARAADLDVTTNDPLFPHLPVKLTATVATGYDAQSPWPKWGHDNANTGRSTLDTSAVTGALAWSFDLTSVETAMLPECALQSQGYYSNSPVLSGDGRVYAFACDGILYALDPITGSVVFNKALNQLPIPGAYPTPVVATNTILDLGFGSLEPHNCFMAQCAPSLPLPDLPASVLQMPVCGYAPYFSFFQIAPAPPTLLSAQNQKPTSCVASGLYGYPVDYTPYVSSTPVLLPAGQLAYAVSSTDYYQQGSMTLPADPTNLAVYVHPPDATVGAFQQHVYVVDPTSLAQPSLQTIAPAVGDDGTLYFCSQGACLALDSSNGATRWSTLLGPEDYTKDYGAPVLGNGQLYIFAVGSAGLSTVASLQALDQTTGLVQWKFALPGFALSLERAPTAWGTIASPALSADNRLIVPYLDGVYAVEVVGPSAGNLAWKLPITGGSVSTPVIGGDGTIYLGTKTQGFWAIDPQTHAPRWKFTPPAIDGGVSSISGAAAIASEQLFFTADNGRLYAVH